jgi:hypothetical protein
MGKISIGLHGYLLEYVHLQIDQHMEMLDIINYVQLMVGQRMVMFGLMEWEKEFNGLEYLLKMIYLN